MYDFILNTDLTITTEKVTELFKKIRNHHVDDVGICLGLPLSKVDDIMNNYHSAAQRRDACIDAFINDHPCPHWRYVSRALCDVDLDHQAGVVERTYVQGTVKITWCLLVCQSLMCLLWGWLTRSSLTERAQ